MAVTWIDGLLLFMGLAIVSPLLVGSCLTMLALGDWPELRRKPWQ
jgi:hypothetical protein